MTKYKKLGTPNVAYTHIPCCLFCGMKRNQSCKFYIKICMSAVCMVGCTSGNFCFAMF